MKKHVRITFAFALAAAAALALTPGLAIAGASGDELALGSKGPAFELPATDGKTYSLATNAGAKGTLVVFTCNVCPYSKAYEARIIDLTKAYAAKGISVLAINPNNDGISPGDSFDEMKKLAAAKSYPFPYLRDETGVIGKAYGAKVTPHTFLLDATGTLVYRGRIDDSSKPAEVKKRDLTAALDALVAGSKIEVAETKAFGCSVKYKKT